jgi:hypothetical protein
MLELPTYVLLRRCPGIYIDALDRKVIVTKSITIAHTTAFNSKHL